MGQQVNVYRKLKFFPGAIVEGGFYSSVGKSFYVDTYHAATSDSNSGLDPNYPLESIQAAMDLCTSDANDYIYVIDAYNADATAIVQNTAQMWHLIGIQNPNCPWVNLNAQSATENILESGADINGLNYSEISGIGFGGGATGAGGILFGQTIGCWVHDCSFGSNFAGNTPDYGIHGGAQNHELSLIEDNQFFGSTNAGGTIAVDGIYLPGATPSKNITIRNNVFLGIPGRAIYINARGGIITGNQISMDADTAGAGITLGTASIGCWIDGNSANFGDTDAATGPPWKDDAAGGADQNNWGLNYTGGAASYPA